MANWAIVTSAKNGNADGSAGPYVAPHSGTVDATGADCYLVVVSYYNNNAHPLAASDIVDVAGNTYTIVVDQPSSFGASAQRTAVAIAKAPTTSAVEKWTVSNVAFGGINAVAISGSAGAGATITHVETNALTGIGNISIQAGSINTAGNFVFTATGDYAPPVVSIDSSFAIIQQNDYTAANNIGATCAWNNNAGGISGSVNPLWTFSLTPTEAGAINISITPQSGSVGAATGTSSGAGVGQSTGAGVGSAAGQASGSAIALITGLGIGAATGAAAGAGVASTPSAITITATTAYPPGFVTSNKVITVQATGTTTDVVLTGGITGNLQTPLEANWQGGSYAPLTGLTISGSTWTATFPSQAKGQGVLIVRVKDATSVNATVQMDIGDSLVVFGDSTGATGATDNNYGITTGTHVWLWDGGNSSWNNALNQTGVYFWAQLGIQLRAYLGYPVFIINGSTGGATLNPDWYPLAAPVTLYSQMVNTIAPASELQNGWKCILGEVGSNNIHAPGFGTTPDASTLKGWLDNERTGTVADFGGAPYLQMMIASKGPEALWPTPADFAVDFDGFRQGILDYWDEGSNRWGANLTGMIYSDEVHPDSIAQGQYMAFQWYIAILDNIYNGGGGRGPQFSFATIDPTNKLIDVTFNQTLGNSLSSSVGGFTVYDNGTDVSANITGQVVQTASSVRVTLNTAIVGTATISFASGQNACGETVPTSIAYALPDTTVQSTITVPAEPFFAEAMSSNIGTGSASGAAAGAGVGQSSAQSVGAVTATAAGAAIAANNFGVSGQASAAALAASNFGVFGQATVHGVAVGGANLALIPQLRARRAVLPM